MYEILSMPFILGEVTFPDAVWDIVEFHATTDGVQAAAYVFENEAAWRAGVPLAGGFRQELNVPASAYEDPEYAPLVALIKDSVWSVMKTNPDLDGYFADGVLYEPAEG